MIEGTLKDLGFSEKETVIYLTLTSLGEASAGDIAKNSNINRTTVYDILSELMKKGLVNKVKTGNKTHFGALEPTRLLSYIDREIENTTEKLRKQKKEVEEQLSELVSLANSANTKPKVQFFEGEKGMREAYEDTLTAKEPIIAYANVETMHQGLPNFFPTYYRRRAEADVYIRAILPKNGPSIERSTHDREEMRQTRFLPDGNEFSPEVNIYNNKVLIASWKEKMAVIIESKEFADFHRVIFENLWGRLEK